MKLEVGKKYVCRNRSDIEYVVITRYIGPDALYPFRGEAKNTSGVYEPVSYDIDGSWVRPSHSANLDLIAEYVEPSLGFKFDEQAELPVLARQVGEPSNPNSVYSTVKLEPRKPRLQISDVVTKLHRMLNKREYLSRELQNDLVCDLLDLARMVINKPTKD